MALGFFQNQILTWSARSGCPGCWTSLWLGRQSRKGLLWRSVEAEGEKVPFMWMIFWGLLLFVFFDFRINGIVFTPDFVGFFLGVAGDDSCRGIQTFARMTGVQPACFQGGEICVHRIH